MAGLVDDKGLEVFGELAGSYPLAALSRLQVGDTDDARSRLREFIARIDPVPT